MTSVISAYDKIAPNYENILGSIYKFAAAEVDAFFAGLAKGSRVLDAGCGPGFESAIGSKLGLRMTGLDACSGMLARFRANVPEGEALFGDVSRIPSMTATFDAIFSSCVLLHLPQADAVTAIREFHRVLKPGGKLFLVTNIANGEEVWVSRPVLAAAGVEKLYFHNWEKGRLLATITETGFAIDATGFRRIKPEAPEVIFITATKKDESRGG